jgi:hypothetical protein
VAIGIGAVRARLVAKVLVGRDGMTAARRVTVGAVPGPKPGHRALLVLPVDLRLETDRSFDAARGRRVVASIRASVVRRRRRCRKSI